MLAIVVACGLHGQSRALYMSTVWDYSQRKVSEENSKTIMSMEQGKLYTSLHYPLYVTGKFD